MSGGGTRELKRELFSKLVQLAEHAKGTPLGAFPASSPMVAVQGQGKQSLACGVEAAGQMRAGEVGGGNLGRCGRPNRRSWMQATVFSGLTDRDRGLGMGILVHQAVCSPGGSHLPPPTIHTNAGR